MYNFAMGALKQRPITLYFIVLILLLVSTRLFHVGCFVATDEARWFNRAANFYYALGQRDYAETYLNNSVAVFTMWITTLAFLIKFPGYRGQGQGYLHFLDPEWGSVFIKNGVEKLDVLVWSRMLMAVALILMALLIFCYLKRLVGSGPAFAAAVLIALDPFYIALSRTSHLDAPMATFLVLSLLAFQAFLEDRKRTDLILSGAAGGLAFLSKLPGILVIAGILGVVAISWFSREASVPIFRNMKDPVRMGAAWSLSFVVVVFALWPALWVAPVSTLERALTSPLNYIEPEEALSAAGLAGEGSPGTNRIGSLLSNAVENTQTYALSFLWRTSPVVLAGLLFAAAGYRSRWRGFAEPAARRTAWLLLFTAIYFVVLMSIPYKAGEKYEKYIISSYLALDALAGIGWYALIDRAAGISRAVRRHWVIDAGLFVLIAVQGVGVFAHFPHYFTYYNPLLGGSRIAGQTRFVGVGEGLAEAAMYLNELPEAENLDVYAWYGIGPFSYFFDGRTKIIPTGVTYSDNFRKNVREADYLVVYNNQWYRRIPPELFDILDTLEPVHRVVLNQIEYVRIYRTADIPLE